jgi:hypothetical protein
MLLVVRESIYFICIIYNFIADLSTQRERDPHSFHFQQIIVTHIPIIVIEI